ncbi:MAG: hypothetical protein LBV74_02545 [Tannerella sp.]|jgi:hypothetical protein|nr:hypothetical protein [Tannerella sp.]
MKKNLIYLCLFVFTMGCFGSCSDDDDAKDDLVGTWNLKPGSSMDMTWESSEEIEIAIGGISMPMATSEVAKLAANYGSTLLPGKLKSITFKDNNKLEATYMDSNTENWVTAVYGTYKVVSSTKINFSPDVDKLLEGVEGIDNATMIAIKALAVKGVPVHYTLGDNLNDAHFYLNTSTIKEMKPLFTLLAASMSGDDAQGAMIKSIIEKLPTVLDNTDKIEIGLNFAKAAN